MKKSPRSLLILQEILRRLNAIQQSSGFNFSLDAHFNKTTSTSDEALNTVTLTPKDQKHLDFLPKHILWAWEVVVEATSTASDRHNDLDAELLRIDLVQALFISPDDHLNSLCTVYEPETTNAYYREPGSNVIRAEVVIHIQFAQPIL